MTKQRQTETVEQSTKRKKTDRDFKRRKREEMRHQFLKDGGDCTGEDMTNVINRAMKKSNQFLQSLKDGGDCTGEDMKNVINCATKEAKKNYTGHGIQQTPICIGHLCVLYAIVSLLAQKPFTNLPRKTLVCTVKDFLSKVTKSTTKPH